MNQKDRPLSGGWRPVWWVVTSLAVVLTGWNSHRLRAGLNQPPARPRQYVEEWGTYAEGRVYLDSPEGATVIVFTDYRCGACADLFRRFDRWWARSESRPRILVRNFPLLSGSSDAAAAVECAADQGHFARMGRELYRRWDEEVDSLRYAELAAAAGVPDTARFHACLADTVARGRIARDLEAASELGLYGTPSILVERELYVGEPAGLRRIVRRVSARPKAALSNSN